MKYLSANYPGEAQNEIIPLPVTNEVENAKQYRQTNLCKDVLAELAKEMRATRMESEMLRVQLCETREKVTNLELS